jgi:hypothetical protein
MSPLPKCRIIGHLQPLNQYPHDPHKQLNAVTNRNRNHMATLINMVQLRVEWKNEAKKSQSIKKQKEQLMFSSNWGNQNERIPIFGKQKKK